MRRALLALVTVTFVAVTPGFLGGQPTTVLASSSVPTHSGTPTDDPVVECSTAHLDQCPQPGRYRADHLIYTDPAGYDVTWAQSEVHAPPAGEVPQFWTVTVVYRNTGTQNVDFTCGEGARGNSSAASLAKEWFLRDGNVIGEVDADRTTCSDNSGDNSAATFTLAPGETQRLTATFHNVPWTGDQVGIEWGTVVPNNPPRSDFYPMYGEPLGAATTPPPTWHPLMEPPTSWSGVGGGQAEGVTSVTGTWTVPKVECVSGEFSRAATWVGLTGAWSNPRGLLPQIGTESVCNGVGEIPGVSPLYHVIYQLAGRSDQAGGDQPTASVNVEPGQTVTATVAYDANRNEFTGKINLPGWDSVLWSMADHPNADFSVATAHALGACILERSVPNANLLSTSALAEFENAGFSECRVDGTSVAAQDETFQFPMDGDRVAIVDTPDLNTGAFHYKWRNH